MIVFDEIRLNVSRVAISRGVGHAVRCMEDGVDGNLPTVVGDASDRVQVVVAWFVAAHLSDRRDRGTSYDRGMRAHVCEAEVEEANQEAPDQGPQPVVLALLLQVLICFLHDKVQLAIAINN